MLRTPNAAGSSGGWRVNSLSKGRNYGPTGDHTTGDPTGEFFWLNKLLSTTYNVYDTKLVINNRTSTGFRYQCLRFWYQINTPTISSFNIYVLPPTSTSYLYPRWTVPYTHFDRWTRGQLTIYAPYMHKIVFDFYLANSAPMNSSFIALDDVSITSGQCEAPVACDFDNDMCSWSNVRTQLANWNWAKFTGKR